MKTTLTPRDYQIAAVTTICNSHHRRSHSRVVLAAATGSGKTEMAIMIIDNFVRRRLGRVLVIAHHTNIIKSNFIDRLNNVNVNFSYSDTNTDVDCFVAIRSKSLSRIDFDNYDLLIVDEAHQNYFANTCQTIASRVNHQVLLTATPSKFVRAGGFNILPVARLDIPNEHFASLSFRVVNAETNINSDSYNSDNVVKSTVKFHRSEVKSMCDSIINYLDDNKKLFICKDIEQAKATALYLTSLGITTAVSDSKTDSDNTIAESFKSGFINSLCVVDRMRVGYSDNNLYHTIDMSFTHNPDVIMQILSRSNRGNQSQSKQYIKLTNNALNVRTRLMLSIALALFKSDNLISFDGTFASVNVPVVKNSGATRVASGTPSDNWFIPDCIDVVNFFNDCDFVDTTTILYNLGYVHYTYDICLQIAKNYNSWSDICNNESGVRSFINNNNLRDQFINDTGFASPTQKSTGIKYTDLDKSTVMALASKFTYLYEFKSSHSTALKYATDHNFVDELINCDGNFLSAPVRKCECCGNEFRNKRSHSVYCSTDCKKAVRYQRVKAQRAEQKAKFGNRLY